MVDGFFESWYLVATLSEDASACMLTVDQ